ncbi:MAG: hypothetical protein M3308_04650 [Actinomycetota bacterium]|nr:hypothetical protein [Actinomycetota bacterium]
MKRSFWFSLGIAVGLTLARKASGAARGFTPAGIAENVGDAVRELATAIGSFGADVRAGMMEREAELYATVAARTGIDPTPPQAIAGQAVHVPAVSTARLSPDATAD